MSKTSEKVPGNDGFSGKFGFIIACIGSAVGMANIWHFPYLVSEYGGLTFLLPYLLSCIFLGIALSTLFRYRENSLLLLLFTSIPFLMLSGASIPKECMPEWLYAIGKVVPSSSGVDGFVRIQTMGATLSEVSVQWCTLWVLTAVYFGLACLGMRNIIRRVENRQE